MFAVDDLTRWSNLRSFGNASLVRYSALVPIFGYLIIFNQEIVKLLTIHSEFCVSPDRCRITWKLMSLYFGGCAFALGSIIYTASCPEVIKRHQTATDFFEKEKMFYALGEHLKFLFSIVDAYSPRALTDPSSQALRQIAHERNTVGTGELNVLAGIMGAFWQIENRRRFWLRVLTFTSFALGAVLVAVPTLATFFEICLIALRQSRV